MNRNVLDGQLNVADVEPGKNNNDHYGIMMQVQRYFHISIDNSDCCEYSVVVSERRCDFVFMYDTWLEMHFWTVT